MLNPSTIALSNPFGVCSRGWGTLIHQNHAAGEENSSIMVGMLVFLCLASKKSSKRDFFVPAGTLLGVKLFNCFRGTQPPFLLQIRKHNYDIRSNGPTETLKG